MAMPRPAIPQSGSGRGCRRRSSTLSAEYLQDCNPLSQSASDGSCRTLVEGTARLCPITGGPRGPPWVCRNLGGRGTGLSCRENNRDLHLTAYSPFSISGAPLARPRATSHRTSRVELPMRPVHALLHPLVFSLQTFAHRESWAGCRKEEDAEQIMICIISTLASGHLIVVQA